ncbi:MAG TPA: hypothetical protein VGO70_02445 [Arsenicitalea sp.]|nr:hypothetical protein [Arsenicitalea sp.]
MLIEAAIYAANLPGTPARFWPCLSDSIGLWARGRRCAKAWAQHVAHTTGCLERTISRIEPRRTVVVLGSGPLFDVPLEALAAAFETVILVDQAHLLPARRRASRFGNVRFEWRDLSAANTSQPLQFLHSIAALDWVISVNLVSQLAHGAPTGQERRVVDSHFDDLAGLRCAVTVVTDTAYQKVNRTGGVVEEFDLLHGRPMPVADRSWGWDVAPFGEEAPALRRVHSVAFYGDWLRHNDRVTAS